jgi:hypothetical protein
MSEKTSESLSLLLAILRNVSRKYFYRVKIGDLWPKYVKVAMEGADISQTLASLPWAWSQKERDANIFSFVLVASPLAEGEIWR